MGPRSHRAVWATVTAVGILAAFAPAVVGLRTLSQRDTSRLYAPVRTLVVEALREGRLPLWNPYESTGKPLFADGIHSVLHPISLLGAAVAPSSIDLVILAYLVAAGLGAYLVARALGASPPASAGAGLAFALSGYSASMTGNLVFLSGLSTLPWLVAAAGSAGRGSRWGTVATALATACAFFSGDAQVALVGLALGLLLAADAGGPRGTARSLAGMAAGVLLAGVQILATWELLPLTFRANELPSWEKNLWPLAPARILEWIVPGLFRGPLSDPPSVTLGEWQTYVFAESVYLGAPLLVAAGLGAFAPAPPGRRRTGVLLGSASLALLWLALGHHLGARQLLDWIPVWSRFRYSEKLMAPLTLCVCALGALGIDAFAAGRFPRALKRAVVAAAIGAATLLLTLLFAPAPTRALAIQLLGDHGPFYRSTLTAGLPHLLVALAALLGISRLGQGSRRAPALTLLIALTSAAAVDFGAHLVPRDAGRIGSPLRLESDSPTPRLAQPEPGAHDPARFPDFAAWTTRVQALILDPALNVAQRVDTILGYGALAPGRYTTLAGSFGNLWPRLFRRFGLTHVVFPMPHADLNPEGSSRAIDGAWLVQRDDAVGVWAWAVPHRPWAFFAARAVAADGPEAAHRAVIDLVVLGDDGTVILEAPLAPPTAAGRVLGVERGTERVRVEAESDGPALLVVQDAWWPGWRAAIDGEPAEILAADYLVRAVRWPAGRHRLEMVYDPPEIRVGLALSALGAGLVLLLAALALRRRRAIQPAASATPSSDTSIPDRTSGGR